MVLDYNKMEHHQRQTSSANTFRDGDDQQDNAPATINIRSEPILAIDQERDIALVTEEVIDGKWKSHHNDCPLTFR